MFNLDLRHHHRVSLGCLLQWLEKTLLPTIHAKSAPWLTVVISVLLGATQRSMAHRDGFLSLAVRMVTEGMSSSSNLPTDLIEIAKIGRAHV